MTLPSLSSSDRVAFLLIILAFRLFVSVARGWGVLVKRKCTEFDSYSLEPAAKDLIQDMAGRVAGTFLVARIRFANTWMPRRMGAVMLSVLVNRAAVVDFASIRWCSHFDYVVPKYACLLCIWAGKGDADLAYPRTSLTVGIQTYPKKKHLTVI